MRRTLLLLAGAVLAFVIVALCPFLLGATGVSSLGTGLSFQGALDRGLLLALVVVFTGGVLTSLTPCVYPLIPVTVAIFGATRDRGRLRAMALSTFYVLGMASMYATLGLTAALTGRLLGGLMTSVWVMGAIAVLLVVLAASMLGAFDIRLPSRVQAKLSGVGGEGLAGAFAMGLVAGLIAAPCTGPVLGGVLAYVAASQDVLLGALLLFVFAVGMGLLFFLIATFSVSLPKSGPWMDGVRSLFAVILLVAALWFLKDALLPLRTVLVAADWVPWLTGALVALGVLLGGVHRAFGDGAGAALLKSLGMLLMVGGAFMRFGGLTVVSDEDLAAIDWVHDEGEAMELAASEGRPVLIDFRADWCTACIELERHTFPHHLVAAEAERFVALKIDATDDREPVIEALLKEYEISGLPSVLFLDSSGDERRDLRVESFVPPREMLRRMRLVD